MCGKNRSSNRRCRLAQFRTIALLSMFVAIAAIVGCGVDVQNLFYQGAGALGRTYLDLVLTDLVNELADAQEGADDQDDGDADDGDQDDGGDDGGGGNVDGDVPIDELIGDPAAGEPLFASCAVCHCADASGGCLPGTPSVVSASAESLDELLRGGGTHPPSNLTNQEIVDLEAYLATLGG